MDGHVNELKDEAQELSFFRMFLPVCLHRSPKRDDTCDESSSIVP